MFFKKSNKRYLKKVILSAWMYFGDSWCGGGGAGSGASQLKSAPVPHPANHSPNPTPNYLKSTLILDFTPLSSILLKKYVNFTILRNLAYSRRQPRLEFFNFVYSGQISVPVPIVGTGVPGSGYGPNSRWTAPDRTCWSLARVIRNKL